MKFRNLIILEPSSNKKGDLFCRLMSDVFHSLGYGEPRFDISKSGREIDIRTSHRVEQKIAIAECKAHKDKIGGSDINKFIGALDAERKKIVKNNQFKSHNIIGYFASISGFRETAIEQEDEIDNQRLILLGPVQIIEELVHGKIIVPVEVAISKINAENLKIYPYADIIATSFGWVWAIYLGNSQSITDVAFVHAEGELLLEEMGQELLDLDKLKENYFLNLNVILNRKKLNDEKACLDKYFNYIETECGEIHFEGLPTDKDAGSIKVKLEKIFIKPLLNKIEHNKQNNDDSKDIGAILKSHNRITILAKPGGGKSTLIKRLATSYAFSDRQNLIDDNLPKVNWLPLFIRCRELGDKAEMSITKVISNIIDRAELSQFTEQLSTIFSKSLQAGTALLLIDGLDEISDDRTRIKFIDQLRTFVATYPTIKIVITSREAGFRAVAGIIASYCTNFRIAPLSNSDIQELTLKWHQIIIDNSNKTSKEANALSDVIINDSRLRALADNPLLLTTLLFVKRWAGYLPTRKSVLYQEMIKLLLVTWNVEGHEQIDIEEAEPQLSYIAFYMTNKGTQSINFKELKNCLITARKQMPDILGYTKISVAEFIKRVESRSSLLILSGHEKLDTSEVVPIYEFLHLSFQEYLTAKAIVENYLPNELEDQEPLDILTPHLNKKNWKEVIPLVAVLLRRKSTDLIEYLINASKFNTYKEAKKREKIITNRITPQEHLGNCLASEIQINPELLTSAIEWFSKNIHTIRGDSTVLTILNGKFKSKFKETINELYYNNYNDLHSYALGDTQAQIYIQENKDTNPNQLLDKIKRDLISREIRIKCNAMFGLMYAAFKGDLMRVAKTSNQNLTGILIKFIESDDQKEVFPALWVISWIDPSLYTDTNQKEKLQNRLLIKWMNLKTESNLTHVCTWALRKTMTPNDDLTQGGLDYKDLQKLVVERKKKPRNENELMLCHFLSINLNYVTSKHELEKYFNNEYKKVSNQNQIKIYASHLGFKI